MILSSHIALGVAIGSATTNPVLGFIAGIISHHLVDMIPHTDVGSYGGSVHNLFKERRILIFFIVDVFLALLILLVGLKLSNDLLILSAATGSALPDVIDNSPLWSPYLRKKFPFNYYHLFHEKLHCTITERRYLWLGYLTQVLIIVASLYLVVK